MWGQETHREKPLTNVLRRFDSASKRGSGRVSMLLSLLLSPAQSRHTKVSLVRIVYRACSRSACVGGGRVGVKRRRAIHRPGRDSFHSWSQQTGAQETAATNARRSPQRGERMTLATARFGWGRGSAGGETQTTVTEQQ